jgi:predicted type IV restriction endonuclease
MLGPKASICAHLLCKDPQGKSAAGNHFRLCGNENEAEIERKLKTNDAAAKQKQSAEEARALAKTKAERRFYLFIYLLFFLQTPISTFARTP